MADETTGTEDLDLQEFDPEFEKDELTAALAERDEMRDRYMRALADAENARKRGDRDRREAEQYGSTRLARDLLPVYDNLKRALTAVPEELKTQAAALTEGVELTLRETAAAVYDLRSASSSRPVLYRPYIMSLTAATKLISRYGRWNFWARALQSPRIWRRFSMGI